MVSDRCPAGTREEAPGLGSALGNEMVARHGEGLGLWL